MSAEDLKRVWRRPSFIIFCSKNPIQNTSNPSQWDFDGGEVLYLTDDNRSVVNITPQRIGNKRRMIDGTMRSYYVADKKSFSTSWSNIPSRSIDASRTYISEYDKTSSTSGFGAGSDIKSWYETYTGDFWVLMVYDADTSTHTDSYAEKYNVMFESFDYSVKKRGQFNDLWDVGISLVEV